MTPLVAYPPAYLSSIGEPPEPQDGSSPERMASGYGVRFFRGTGGSPVGMRRAAIVSSHASHAPVAQR